MEYSLDFYGTLAALVAVLLIGRFFIAKITFLRDFNIPEPVVGGLIVAAILALTSHFAGIDFKFDNSFKDPLLLAFYTSIGLSADFVAFKKGGKILFIFLAAVAALLVLQNAVGVGAALVMGVDPLVGLLGGSITMSGGHGTGAAWAEVFGAAPYNFGAATEAAIAAATFGLVAGGIVGGPVASFLVRRRALATPGEGGEAESVFEKPDEERKITAASFIESLALIAISLLVGTWLSSVLKGGAFTLPTFVYCLLVGAILRNLIQTTHIHQVFDREIYVIGNVSLSLFLAFVLMTIDLSKLVSLALPMSVILVLQVTLMVFFAIFVTFNMCGRNYDAAVLAAGHCGFGLGATPTAIANMQAVTNHYGMSHMAFLIVPLVGAFLIDLVNALVIAGFLKLPVF